MHIKDTLDTGLGWILPDNTCLELSDAGAHLKTLMEYDPNIESLFLAHLNVDFHHITRVLEKLYECNYVRAGRYKETVLFEHGVYYKPDVHKLQDIIRGAKYRGYPMTVKARLYDPTSNYRNRYFNDAVSCVK